MIGENIELIGNLDDDVWPVLADPSQISQVIMNLAINGRDAMPAGGILTIATSKAFLSDLDLGTSHGSSTGGLRAGDYTCLSVSDAGCGMDQSILARVFEPFFSTKGPKKGSGLGMATVYGIVTQSKGHIDIDSQPDKGTTVRVYLPRSLEEAKVSAPTSAATALGEHVEHLGGSETILLVEDEGTVRILAKRILEMNGYKMITAPDAESALEAFELHGGLVDLLLTDVVLPGMRGPDLAERLRITQPQLRVLYMSGYTDTDMAQQDLLDEVAGYLQKPFHSSELIRKVRWLLDSK